MVIMMIKMHIKKSDKHKRHVNTNGQFEPPQETNSKLVNGL